MFSMELLAVVLFPSILILVPVERKGVIAIKTLSTQDCICTQKFISVKQNCPPKEPIFISEILMYLLFVSIP